MDFETPKIEQKEKITIKNTGEFKTEIEKALQNPEKAKNILCEAEKWLEEVKKHPEKYPNYSPKKDEGRWIDHRENDLFETYRKIKDWDGANRIIESMQNTPHAKKYNSKQGKINILSKEIDDSE